MDDWPTWSADLADSWMKRRDPKNLNGIVENNTGTSKVNKERPFVKVVDGRWAFFNIFQEIPSPSSSRFSHHIPFTSPHLMITTSPNFREFKPPEIQTFANNFDCEFNYDRVTISCIPNQSKTTEILPTFNIIRI